MISYLTALNCEARALIDHHALKKTDDGPFAYYVSKDSTQQVELLVSGMGISSMSAAVGWLAAKNPCRNRVWLNVGIAGHSDLEIGCVVLVHGCSDSAQGRAHYPPLVVKWPAKVRRACLSHNTPNSDYTGDALADMEAHGFFSAATKFSSSELVQSLKVVSDNSSDELQTLNAAKIEQLVRQHTQVIVEFAQALSSLSNTVPEYELLALPSELHITHSQRQQINNLAVKAKVMGVWSAELQQELNSASSAKDLLNVLTTKTAGLSPVLA